MRKSMLILAALLLSSPALAASITFQFNSTATGALTKTYTLTEAEAATLINALKAQEPGNSTNAQALAWWAKQTVTHLKNLVAQWQAMQVIPTPIDPK